MRYRVLSPWTIAAWAVLTVLVGVGVAVWLLLAYTGGNTDANRVQLDAIRTAGTIVVGTGGAAALLLAARRQRTAEIALKQKDRDQADVARAYALQERVAEQARQHQERVAAATEADAEARRITDLYTMAADQLGSDKAPVRLAGLYALERLAQDNPGQRQTIVNVLCAYLRMPYTVPGDPPADDADNTVAAVYREQVQEREVRLAAQRILTHHLRPGNPDHPVEIFWADTDLDLTSATLINLDLTKCAARGAHFGGATFISDAWFDGTTFTGDADFGEATFTSSAWFSRATFTSAWFEKAVFAEDAWFHATTFNEEAEFGDATFTSKAKFGNTNFAGGARFDRTTFTGDADFGEATFTRFARFYEAIFTSNAWFMQTTFTDVALFDEVTLPSTHYTGPDTPSPWTNFAGARFKQGVPSDLVRFLPPPAEDEAGEAT